MASPRSDPILSEDRITLLPIKYPGLHRLYKDHVSAFWTLEEIEGSLANDKAQVDDLTEQETHMLKVVLAFFVVGDDLVMKNVSCNFINEVKAKEAQLFYAFQNAMEGVHVEVYARTIELYFGSDSPLLQMHSNTIPYETVVAKQQFCEQWMDAKQDFATRLVAFSCVEGLFFTASFAFIFWFKKRNRLAGLTISNELIARDEALHAAFAVALHGELLNKCQKDRIVEIVKNAVEVESVFAHEVFNGANELVDLTADDIVAWIKIVADKLLADFGIDGVYNEPTPPNMQYMEVGSVDLKTNFFEERVTSYAKHEPGAYFSNAAVDF